MFLPPPELQARLRASDLDRRHWAGSTPLASCLPEHQRPGACSRRTFLSAAGGALLAFGALNQARAAGPLVFSAGGEPPASPAPGSAPQALPTQTQPPRLGEIPPDFWLRPRSLKLQRQGLKESVNVVYWRDGQLVPEGYWQVCSLMRDVRANVMTTMDPAILDILRGVVGYYEAWRWPHALVLTSGFRTVATNNALSREGSAKNSMHLYGRAVDLYMPGVPQRDIGALGVHLAQGGVGFYPSRGFTHLDTGRQRVWKG